MSSAQETLGRVQARKKAEREARQAAKEAEMARKIANGERVRRFLESLEADKIAEGLVSLAQEGSLSTSYYNDVLTDWIFDKRTGAIVIGYKQYSGYFKDSFRKVGDVVLGAYFEGDVGSVVFFKRVAPSYYSKDRTVLYQKIENPTTQTLVDALFDFIELEIGQYDYDAYRKLYPSNHPFLIDAGRFDDETRAELDKFVGRMRHNNHDLFPAPGSLRDQLRKPPSVPQEYHDFTDGIIRGLTWFHWSESNW
jgi:hypothetical protein